jgi:2-keto-4-pentenoate hydratase
MDTTMDQTPTDASSGGETASRVADAVAPVTDFMQSVQREIRHQAEVRPYTTLLVAAAAGYVLGGGVPTWAGRALMNIGGRLLVARLVAAVVDER